MGLTPRAALDFTRIIIIIIINTATTLGQLVTRLAVRLMLNISE